MKYRVGSVAAALSSPRDRGAQVRAIPESPRGSLRRGVSRFMQNGTWLPREPLLRSTLYLTRARLAAGPSVPPPVFFRCHSRGSSIGPGRGPRTLRCTLHISSNNLDPAAPQPFQRIRTICSSRYLDSSRNDTNGTLYDERSRSRKKTRGIRGDVWNSARVFVAGRFRSSSKGVGINRHLRAG